MKRDGQRTLLALAAAFLWWLPTACVASDIRTGFSVCPSCRDEPKDTESVSAPTHPPHVYPPGMGDPDSESSNWNADANDGIDFLVAAFFLIAAGWLVLALIYSVLVLLVVRLRARGQLDVYDETFGRFYLFGTRCYIPLGCVLRRYVIAMNRERNRNGDPVTVRIMSREERRTAMEKLLVAEGPKSHESESFNADNTNDQACPNNDKEDPAADSNPSPEETDEEKQAPDDASAEEVVCTICLGEYEPSDVCFTSTVCQHRYHRECILEWLERRANTECPCCRTELVSDDEVWETVQNLRQERRRQVRKANIGRGLFWRFHRRQTLRNNDDSFEPTPPPTPTLSPATTRINDVDDDDEDDGDSVVDNFSYSSRPGSADVESGQ